MLGSRIFLVAIVLCAVSRPLVGTAQEPSSYEPSLPDAIERLPPVPDVEEPFVDAAAEEFEASTPPPPKSPGMNGMGPPGGGSGNAPGVQFYWLPERNLQSRTGTLQVVGGQVSFGMPIAKSETSGMWLATGSWGEDRIETNARLESIGRDFPEELSNVRFGLMNFRELDNGWSVGGMFNVESPSDRPFGSIHEMNANVLAFVKVPSGERNSWNFSLMYSPLGQISFPIPGVSYHWQPLDQFQANIGIPFSMNYQPRENVELSLSYMPLTTVNAQLKWSITESLALYTSYRTQNSGYLLADRPEQQQRFFEFDQRVIAGVRYNLSEMFVLDISTGYIFDQSYFLSKSFFSGDRQDEVNVEPGMYAGIRLEFKPF